MSELLLKLLFIGFGIPFDQVLELRKVVRQLVALTA